MAKSRLYLGTALAVVIAASSGGGLQSLSTANAQESQTGAEAVDCTADPAAEGCAAAEEAQAEESQVSEPAPEPQVAEEPAPEQPVEEAVEAEQPQEVAEPQTAEQPEQPAPEEGAQASEAAREAVTEPASETTGKTAAETLEELVEEPAEQTVEDSAEEPASDSASSADDETADETVQSETTADGGEEAVTTGKKQKKKKKKRKAKAEETEASQSDSADGGQQEETAPEGEEADEAETAETETGADDAESDGGDTAEAPQPSPDAPEPKAVAAEPIEEQIEKAEETQTAVVPEKITKAERKKLKKAEKKRRKKARERREELLGAAAAGAVIGALIPILGGRVVEDEGDRFVVERNGEYIVRRDDSALFRHDAERVEIEHLPRGRTRETVYRQNGSRIVTLRDAGGYVLMRKRIRRDGQEIVLFDAFEEDQRFVDYDRTLPPIQITIPRDEYIVPARRYGRRQLAEILAAPPVEVLPQQFTLREVRENERLRQYVRRVDLDTVTFDSGSYYVSESQVPYLADVAGGMLDVIDENPGAVFLVEGHTDAVGPDLYNLTLSDRRAETVARILVEAYGVPPENLVVEGYGEQFLKIDTQADERRNRRVTIRNISPLLQTAGN